MNKKLVLPFKEANVDISDASKQPYGKSFYSIENFNETSRVDNQNLNNLYNFKQQSNITRSSDKNERV